MSLVQREFESSLGILQAFAQPENYRKVEQAVDILTSAFRNGRRVYACGNGGSMAQAIHFAEELTGKFRVHRPALPALALSDPGHLSCVANDYSYDQVFARFLEAHAQAGDVLLALSTSGNSPNLLRAAELADHKQVTTVGLTGRDGGRLAKLLDLEIRVSTDSYSDRVQEVHQVILHALVNGVEHVLFPEAARQS